jgi:hypothetical protein
VSVDAFGQKHCREQMSLLSQPREQHLTAGDDRQRGTRAREAAEALFAPKRPTPKTLAATSSAPADPPARKPRVLHIAEPSSPPEKAEPEVGAASPVTSVAPGLQAPRIRTLLKYGMTVAQVAAVYGVAVDDIERALQRV